MENARKKRVKKSDIGYGYDSVFPVQLRKLLDERTVTQETLAEALEVSRQSVAQWKDGKTMPDIHYLKKLSGFFNVSYEYLLDGIPTMDKGNVDIGERLCLSDKAIKMIEEQKKKDGHIQFFDKLLCEWFFWRVLGEAISYIKANKDLYHKNLSGERGFSDSARDKIIEASNILDNTGVRLMFNYEAADYHMFNIQKYLSKAIEAIAELERDGADNGKH